MQNSAMVNDALPYHLLLDNMGSGFAYHKIIIDNKGTAVDYEFLFVNKAFEKVTGLQREVILDRRVTDIYPEIENKKFPWIKIYGKVALTGVPIVFEHFFDPHQQWYSISVYCPHKGFFAATFENITARKQTKLELKKRAKQLKIITDHSMAFIAYVGIDDLRYKFVNKKYADSFNLPRENIIGKHIRDVIGLQNYKIATKYIKKVKGGEVVSYESAFDLKEGKRFIKVNYVPEFNDQKRVISIVILSYDITELKKTQAALQESEKTYRLLFEKNVNSIFLFSPETMTIIDANPAMTALYGYSREELVGKNCFELSSEVQESIRASKVIKGHGRVHVETIWHKKKDSSVFPIEIEAFSVEMDGRLVNYAIIKDLTERKQLEEKKELLDSRIQQSSKMEAVGTLAAGIAHEINTPTQFIGTNIDFMNEATKEFCSLINQIQHITANAPHEISSQVNNALEEADWEYLSTEIPQAISQSQEGIKRVTSIVQAMKEFSHPGGKEKCLYDLNQIIKTTVTVSTNEWKYVAEIDLDLGSDLPKIPLLVDEVEQIFLNMLVNATHAIGNRFTEFPEEKKGKIKISSNWDGESIEVRISDNGTGMPQSVKNHAFTPFFTTKEVGQGTGQGLSMVYRVVVNKHNGTIDCESEEGVGTSFILRLPITA